jgi:hypothetical protein
MLCFPAADIPTAVFFAFHKFIPQPDGSFRVEALKRGTQLPVLYGLWPRDESLNAYRTYGPRAFKINRPRAQQAVFSHTGWGLSRNDGARGILFALYLDFDPADVNLPSAGTLFPARADDAFGAYVEDVAKRSLPDALARHIKSFGWVDSEHSFGARSVS